MTLYGTKCNIKGRSTAAEGIQQISELGRQNLKIVTGAGMTADKVKQENPDTVIAATGAKSFRRGVKGVDRLPSVVPEVEIFTQWLQLLE